MIFRRLPVVPTLIVFAAVAVMVRLGFWQLERLRTKEMLLARYAAAAHLPETEFIGWSGGGDQAVVEPMLYRRAWLDCVSAGPVSGRAGHNDAGETGWAERADCTLARGSRVTVVLGWTDRPAARVVWRGGLVHGTFGAGRQLVADPPLAGLRANARPDPADIPNNHLSYAVQWFLFAATALVIYALALRKRLHE